MSAELVLGWRRYEKARKLTPLQWAKLHARNLAGENFDEMIDALPEPSTPLPAAEPIGLPNLPKPFRVEQPKYGEPYGLFSARQMVEYRLAPPAAPSNDT